MNTGFLSCSAGGRGVSVAADLEAELIGQHRERLGVAALDDDEVRLKAGADALLHDLAAGSVGLHDDGRADELLGLVEHGALGDEEAEGAVRLAADAEHGGVREGLAAEVHGRADLAVRMHADDGAGVAPREGAGRHAAVPVGDGALVFIERHGVAEEHCLARQLHAHPQEVKKSGQQREERAPMWFSFT